MKRSIVLSTKLATVTQSQRRPEEERNWSMDVTAFNQKEFELAANNEAGNLLAAEASFGPAAQFVSFYSPRFIELTVDSLIIPSFKGLFILSAPVLLLKARNLSREKPAVCSLVYA